MRRRTRRGLLGTLFGYLKSPFFAKYLDITKKIAAR